MDKYGSPIALPGSWEVKKEKRIDSSPPSPAYFKAGQDDGGWEVSQTNLAGASLHSAARNNKATRLLTWLVQTTKSSAKDLSLRIVKLQYTS